MNYMKILCFIFLYQNVAFCQLTIGLNTLPLKATLQICAVDSTHCTLYATVHTDTLKKCRLWLFYDSSKIEQEPESILLELFDNHNLIKKQFFLSVDRIVPIQTWEYIDFLSNLIYSKNLKLIEHSKKEILNLFLDSLPPLMSFFNKDLVATVRYAKISYHGLQKNGFWRYANWKSALQVAFSEDQDDIMNWLLLAPIYKTENIIEIHQSWFWHYDDFTLIRRIDKTQLISMRYEGVGVSNVRHFRYDDMGKLLYIKEGIYLNEFEMKLKAIIYVFKQ